MSKNFLKGLLSLLTIVSAVVLSSCLDMEEQDNRSRDNDIEELKEYLSKRRFLSAGQTQSIMYIWILQSGWPRLLLLQKMNISWQIIT